jgi:serine/threonine protein kinase
VTLDFVSLPFYGITKDPNSSEFMMVTGLAEGSLRKLLEKGFNKLTWLRKLRLLLNIIKELKIFHERGICHKDLHSGNILLSLKRCYLTDFGLSGPSNKSSEKVYGVLGYIAPEVLKGKPYRSHADIYSFGILMTEFSSGFPPYFNKKMDEAALALSICDGLKPDLGKGTPEIYKALAYKCMSANPDERPTANELENILSYWIKALCEDISDDDSKKIKEKFDIADKEIPNVKSLFIKSSEPSNFKYVSKQLDFSNMIKTFVYEGKYKNQLVLFKYIY